MKPRKEFKERSKRYESKEDLYNPDDYGTWYDVPRPKPPKVVEPLKEYELHENQIYLSEMATDIRVIKPENGELYGYIDAHLKYMQDTFAALLKSCCAQEVIWKESGRLPAAAYEKRDYFFDGHIVFKSRRDSGHQIELFLDRLIEMTDGIRFMLHDQIFVEFPELDTLCKRDLSIDENIWFYGLAIGNRVNAGTFLKRGDYFVEKASNPLPSLLTFEHDRKMITATFGVRLQNPSEDLPDYAGYKMQISYDSIKAIFVDVSDTGIDSVYMDLKAVPKLWEAVPKEGTTRLNMEEGAEWVRTLGWTADAQRNGIGCSAEAYSQSPCVQLTFDRNDAYGMTIDYLLEILTRLQSRTKVKILFGPIFSIRRKLAPSPPLHSLGSFRANYAISALISRGSVFMDQLFDAADQLPEEYGEPLAKENEPAFIKLVRKCMKESSGIAEESLEQLVRLFDEHRRIDVLNTFATCYEERKAEVVLAIETGNTDALNRTPKNCVLVRKVVVTPSRALLMPPDIMMENRVLRKFGPENALRCVFRDEDSKKLIPRDFSKRFMEVMPNVCTNAIQSTLKHGFQIADRHFQFLGWSNSQMRDQGCYFYTSSLDPLTKKHVGTIADIRRWMGNFDNVKTVSKMMSRMGQCFTQAQPTITLASDSYMVEPDIMGGLQGKYNFSDGCGRISYSIAKKISKILELEYIPSVFQIRYKGFKGILVVDLTIDDILNMPKIIFRESQEKFEVRDDLPEALEIVKYSMPSEMCLNRPFLTILDHVSEKQSAESHERITKRVHYYLEREFSALSNMLITEKHAAEELTIRVPLKIDWLAVKRSGMELTTDPFIKAMLYTIYKYNVVNHILKAKLNLPLSMGRSMYGVVDETGLLQRGQVFIQYNPEQEPNPRKKPILHLGKVMITKNPCLVPGDVRVFKAVYQPSLSHLVDVVVFPQHGRRPHPDEMAGSDLDGDEYSVVLDPELYLDHNEEPMIYPSGEVEVDEHSTPTVTDTIDVFLRYLSQDAIGRVSTAHLASADFHGLFSKQCESIALKCAVAVDFPKSGIPADPLTRDETAPVAPDYMPSFAKPSYFSTRLNGQIHRKGQRVEELLNHHQENDSETGYDKVLCPDGYILEDHDKFRVSIVYEEYSRSLQYLMDEYGIESEAALVSGHPTSIKRLAAMEKDDYSFYHTDKIVQLRYDEIRKEFRKKFFQEFGGEAANTDDKGNLMITDRMNERARHWYYMSYVQPPPTKHGRFVGRSLPWVIWEVMVDVRRKLFLDTNQIDYSLHHPISVQLSSALQASIDSHLDDLTQFREKVATDKNALFLQKYSNVYGDNIIGLVFLLKQWLEKENVLNQGPLTIWHVGRLLIRFALGEGSAYSNVDYEKSSLAPTIRFPKWLFKHQDHPESETSLHMVDSGTLILEFLRYLSSQTFVATSSQKLRVFADKGIIEPILWQREQWLPLHKLAYRTFHLIAASGKFHALRLDDEVLPEHISESSQPMIIKGSNFCEMDGDSKVRTYKADLINALKTWSGCVKVEIREKPSVFRSAEKVSYVSCVGSALARQRLEKILFLDYDTLIDAVRNKTVPELSEDLL